MLRNIYNYLCVSTPAVASHDPILALGKAAYLNGGHIGSSVAFKISKKACSLCEEATRGSVKVAAFVSNRIGNNYLTEKFEELTSYDSQSLLSEAHVNEVASSLALLFLMYKLSLTHNLPAEHYMHDLMQNTFVMPFSVLSTAGAIVQGFESRRSWRQYIQQRASVPAQTMAADA